MRSIRALRALLLGAILTLTLTLPLALVAASGANAAEGTTTVIHFTPEGLSALEVQLRHHEVHALTFHPKPAPGHVHVSMNDGRHYTVIYSGTGQQEHLIVLANAGGARYAIATSKAKTKSTHHTLRYVAGGILIVVIVVVAAVLLIDRRRKLNEEDAGSGSASGGEDGTAGGDGQAGGGAGVGGGAGAGTGGSGAGVGTGDGEAGGGGAGGEVQATGDLPG